MVLMFQKEVAERNNECPPLPEPFSAPSESAARAVHAPWGSPRKGTESRPDSSQVECDC